jgi:shikimate dehydrogenase
MIGLLAVLGHDVSRSLSPRIHMAASRAMGWSLAYLPISAHDSRDFEEKVDALRVLGALGANITRPYKHDANTVCGERSDVARAIGAVNTLVFRSDGTIAGDNTDGPGMLRLLRDRDPAELEVVRILGAGGSARAVAWAAREAGAERVEVAARRAEQAQSVAEPFGAIATSLEAGEPPTLVVSTLPADPRLAGDAIDRWLDVSRRPALIDLAYNEPGAPPHLALAAQAAGLEAHDGLDLLVEQGALSFCRWTGAALEPVRAAMRAELA